MPFVRCLVFKGGRMSVKWPDWIRSALRSLINTFSSAAAAAAAVDRGENKDLKNMHLGTFFNFLFFGLCWFKSKSQPDTVKKKKKKGAKHCCFHSFSLLTLNRKNQKERIDCLSLQVDRLYGQLFRSVVPELLIRLPSSHTNNTSVASGGVGGYGSVILPCCIL